MRIFLPELISHISDIGSNFRYRILGIFGRQDIDVDACHMTAGRNLLIHKPGI